MEEIMQSNSFFIIPLSLAYLCVCGLWFLLSKTGRGWEIESIETSKKPWLDIGIGMLACAGVIAIGQLFVAGFLIPRTQSVIVNQLLIWPLNNVLIFSPIFLTLFIRKQSLNTIFISSRQLGIKLLFGLIVSVVGIVIFVGLRGEWSRISEILITAIQPKTLSNFPAIFFENVALAFLFVRLKWTVGVKWAIGIPAVLFALAHVPGSVAEGDPISHIITFFFLTGTLTTFILYTAYRSRDILWLGFVHYMMDVAIKAF
ncbi:CPBP family glutamic-type intramembrane protease [Ekhidna sp. To15]|uniref:CPBP family glutamic-type intramembrane protease n=1 Tax=Ekhidna sp. To15 TaxID=3395267 RepID=UPI003F525B31